MNPIAEQFKIQDFDAVRLKLASPEVIRGWSYGEVSNPETINYRTQKPEKGGLFAEEIFGPSKDWECYCGKYKKVRYKGIICDKCGVEVTHSLVRRERMGHIELSAPVTHIWFLRGVPSKIGLVLDLSVQNLEKVIYFANFIVTAVREDAKAETLEQVKEEYKSKKKQIEGEYKRIADEAVGNVDGKSGQEKLLAEAFDLKTQKLKDLDEDFRTVEKELKEIVVNRIISESVYQDWSLKYGHIFDAGIGAEAIRYLLEKTDIDVKIAELEDEMLDVMVGARYDKLVRRVKLLKALRTNGIKPEWMVMVAVPVIPPDLRPMVPLDGGRFAASDLNDLYRRVINRNNRLKKLMDLNAPEVITRNEKRMMQEAVDALFDNSARQAKTVVAATGKKRQLKSLADMLKGKQGRFRQNLLGKRIDYSGRSVIVVGPTLKLNQCGLPKMMALELFKPFVISQLIKRSYCHNIRSANRYIESDHPEVWDILEEITSDSLVLLNRAPTLHRLGIQAFQPKLIEGKAIQIHPMVCPSFNADFDGDQMAVHVPLTEEAKKEARERMMATHNLLKPATGAPIIRPDKDVAWGIYYMTSTIPPQGGRETPRLFSNPKEAVLAYRLRKIEIRELISVRLQPGEKPVETNVGRIILNRVIPEHFGYVNRQLDAKQVGEIVRECLEKCGQERTVELVDDLKNIGYHYITVSGYSWGMADLPAIPSKHLLIEEGDKAIEEVEEQYQEGLLTKSERHSKIIDVWSNIKDRVTKLAKENLPKDGPTSSMIESGARGSWGQLTQIIGIKGLVASPSGEIIELPVKANFKEGFDVLEYFISTHGARKGSSDTALRTANAGYLTRRLVDVSQEVVIREEDCGDTKGNLITRKESDEMGQTVVGRILGRYLLEEIKDPKSGKVIIKKGELVTEEIARNLTPLDLEQVHVRSVLECHLPKGICKKCYGYDLAYNQPVKIGVPVGIMAAQSIGEPGTQLTMRTFHSGGVAGSDITQGLPRVEELFEARPPKRRAFMTEVSGQATVEEIERHMIEGQKLLAPFVGHKIVRIRYQDKDGETYKLNRDEEVLVEEGAKVKEGQLLIRRKDGTEIISERSGNAKINKKSVKVVRDIEKDKDYIIPPGYVIYVRTGDQVEAGQPITDGHLDLQLLYKLRGKEAVQKYVLKNVQAIYTSQGQKLNDKHIEIIVRQMFSRVNVSDAGDTDLLPGEIIEKAQFMIENAKVKESGGQVAKAQELFLGITKISLSTQSFLSSASFQETARVLINAAVTGKVDPLEGLKENIIIGRLIPAGTGLDPVTIYPEDGSWPVPAAAVSDEAADDSKKCLKEEAPTVEPEQSEE
ncbi:MAG: DNA-directed RNA polymerase subunit beta' [Parcubacteria group bacterium CG1_02_58_44]|nr:MAG: DNA-directed RNA polymerase subunit beta' [Parcubacteria group bacterium CG1_02_58_44]